METILINKIILDAENKYQCSLDIYNDDRELAVDEYIRLSASINLIEGGL